MKSNILIFIILGVLLISGGVLYSRSGDRSRSVQEEKPSEHYYCPMHPQIHSDKPGTCPICYMNLVKKEAAVDEPSASNMQEHAPVRLSTEQQQLIGVKTVPVIWKDLTRTIHAYGYVAHDLELYEHQLDYIQAWREYYAFVVRRPTKENFRQDWRDYYVTKSMAREWRSQDEINAQERLVKAEYELRHMGLTNANLVQLREIKPGQPWIQPDLLFFEEGHPVWIYAKIFEQDLGYITIGQKATITIPAYGDVTEGVVRTISEVEPDTRMALVRLELPEYRGELTVNMYADVEIHSELNTALLVPRDAVMDTGDKKIVFVQTKPGSFEPREVQTGMEGDGMIAIKSGLKTKEMVVASGNFLLDSESRLKAAVNHAGH